MLKDIRLLRSYVKNGWSDRPASSMANLATPEFWYQECLHNVQYLVLWRLLAKLAILTSAILIIILLWR